MGKLMVLFFFFFLLLNMFFHVIYCASNFSSFSPALPQKTCLPDESLALLQFKHVFSTDIDDAIDADYCGDAAYPKTNTWEEGADCCSWDGVACDVLTGQVIGLDLSCSMLSGTLHSNSSLFHLSHLRTLNLAYNDFYDSPIPSEFRFLVKLTHLNLSSSDFSGEIPHEISYLSKLVSLDLGHNDVDFQVDNYAFQKLIHNLTELRALDLSGSNMSLVEPKSLLNISSTLRSLRLSDCDLNGVLPDDFSRFSLLEELDLSINYGMTGTLLDSIGNLKSLEHLDLTGCSLNGFIPASIANLEQLKYLDLSRNSLSGILPNSLGNLKSLEHLDLRECSLDGSIPASIANLEQLKYLDLSQNSLSGIFPDSIGNLKSLEHLDLMGCSLNGSILASVANLEQLKYLDLSQNILSGILPDSLGNLKSLEHLDLKECSLDGSIPASIANLEQLKYLDLSQNSLSGILPDSLGNLKSLKHLDLRECSLDGYIPASMFHLTQLISIDLSHNHIDGLFPSNISGLSYLQNLDFSFNQLNGIIPSWLFTIPSLISLDLSNNKFTGCFPIHPLQQPNSLETVHLSNNEIHGPIQNPIFGLLSLTYLDLSSNNLSDIDIEWNTLQRLQNLSTLDLLHNSELSLSGRSSNVNFTLPNLEVLYLSSCNITEFPNFLQTLEHLIVLDLANNQIHGMFPPKQGLEGLKSLNFLNLSSNSLTGLEHHPWNDIGVLDLSSNLIQGPLPVLPRGINAFMISKNKVSGQISSSICICSSLSVLDLSDNRLNGEIPQCLGNISWLEILDLQNNKFHGSIPDTFAHGYNLWYVNLNGNQFERQIPRSLVNCSRLEILDLGNNRLNDTFPYWLGSTLPQLKVLILRSNNIHGVISVPKKTGFIFEELQILDLSHNKFNGILPVTLLGNLKSMMNVERDHDSWPLYVGQSLCSSLDRYFCLDNYNFGMVKVTMKGSEFSMPKIFTFFKSIDLSNNRFEGEIPDVVCKLKALKVLNFSHNHLVGHIPSSFENLTELESLDLSSNKLVGRIPQQLAVLTSLEVLNLSYNKLVGPIPEGRQLSTFPNDSYIGNSGLCGFPLSKKCHSEAPHPPSSGSPHKEDDSTSWFDWKIVMMGYGSGVVIGLSMGYIVFTTGRPWWFVKMVEKKQDKIVRRINRRRRGGRKLGNPRDHQ